jgi:hypothetical protein
MAAKVQITKVTVPKDLAALDSLRQLQLHEASALDGTLPDPHGRFQAVQGNDHESFLIHCDDQLAGFILLADDRSLTELFVVFALRHQGVARQGLWHLLGQRPGPWTLRAQQRRVQQSRLLRELMQAACGDQLEEHGWSDNAGVDWLSIHGKVNAPLGPVPPSSGGPRRRTEDALQELALEELSELRCRYRAPSLADDILIVSAHGLFRDGEQGSPDGDRISAHTLAGLIAFNPSCLILDLRELTYDGSPALSAVFKDISLYRNDAGESLFPLLVVTSEQNRSAVLELIGVTERDASWHYRELTTAIPAAIREAEAWLGA